MALGEITKQFAKQAMGDAVKGVFDSASAEPADLGTALLTQVQAMQKALKEDDELIVLLATGNEMVRVFEIFMPTKVVVVLSGLDPQRNTTRIVTPVHALQLVCKVVKVPAGGKGVAVKINLAK